MTASSCMSSMTAPPTAATWWVVTCPLHGIAVIVRQPFRYAQVILDAKRVGVSPPLCTIHLPVRAPFTFHGIWTPETFGVGEQFCSAPATP